MNASVLIVGEAIFSEQLLQQVRGLSAMTFWQAKTATAAETLLESNLPELVILQAQEASNWEFCRHLKQKKHLVWIYCILLDDRPCPASNPPEEVLTRQASLTTTALEAGADAYIWLPDALQQPPADVAENYLNRLVQAHIRAGLRRVQAYRELSQANDLLSAIALSDALTQLGNRRAFDWELPRQVHNALAQKQPLSLLILDIDFFKAVNDQYGHLVGDQALQMVAERLKGNLRFYETPFRYGGEEFVVLLQNAELADAQVTAERLRELIEDTPFVISAELDLPLTVSIGVATLMPEDDNKGLNLLARADHNLIQAKRSGRNRVVVSQD